MRAAFFRNHGGLDVLEVGDLPSPPMGPLDVRVQVKAAALNHLDLFVRDGWPGFRVPLPHVGGTDVAGVVVEVGDGVAEAARAWAADASGTGTPSGIGRSGGTGTASGIGRSGGTGRAGGPGGSLGAVRGSRVPQVGDEVLVNPGLNFEADPATGEQRMPPDVSIVGETRWGGFAQECVVPWTHVVPKPAGMAWEEAAALPLTSITAMQMVKRKGRVKPGDRVLVVGAGGGVAVMALQFAKQAGAWVCATTGGADKVERVKALGADHVIDYKASPDWSKEAFLASGKKGYDVVLDSTGQATFKQSVRSLALGGRLVLCGATTGHVGEADLRLVFWKQLSILGSTMGIPQDLADAVQLWEQGKLKVVVDSVYPLDRIKEAQERMARAGQFGKIVIKP